MRTKIPLICDPGTEACSDANETSSYIKSATTPEITYSASSINKSDPFLHANVSGDPGSHLETADDWERLYSWNDFQKELRWALPVHVYLFACLFFILSFYTFFSILNLRSQLSTRPFMSTINVFVCVLGVSRAACFLIDPYYSQKVMPGFLGWVLWDVGYPCILSAFALIQLAFSQLTQMTFRPESLRKKSSLSLIIATHFICILASNIVAAFEHKLQLVRTVVQAIFVSWGLVLCCTFLYGGGRILRLLKTLPNSAFQNTEPTISEHKGILQLALLAQCNSIASSVITAAGPSILAPKIKITDENELSFSVGSEASKLSSSAPDAGEGLQLCTVPEINVIQAESPTRSESSPKDKKSFADQQSFVSIEISKEDANYPTEDVILPPSADNDRASLDNEEPSRGSPKRKKSLTWGDEPNGLAPEGTGNDILGPSTSKGFAGATLGCEISNAERRRRRGSGEVSGRRSSTTSNVSNRKNSGNWDSVSRRSSNCSIASCRKGSYCELPSRKSSVCSDVPSRKGSHVGEALVLNNRRGSLTSEISSRRGSNQCMTPGVGACSRRGSHRSVKEEPESETLLRKSSTAGSDVTLSSILNHIAYVNQTSAACKLSAKVKESRKEQVRQVLIVTYVTAVLGMVLSLFVVVGLYSHPPPASPIPPWIWFSYESCCRLFEFLIGCAMANITRQPVNRHPQYGHNLRMKARSSIYM